MNVDHVATEAEIDWALTYAGEPAAPEEVAGVLRALRETGAVPAGAGVDRLRACAAHLAAGPGLDEIGRDWLELLDTIRAHPDTRLADLPPARTD